MKEIKKFSKAFLGCAIASLVIILAGIAGLFIRGINFGIDFKPGLIEEVRIAPTAMELSYDGEATVSVETTTTGLDFVISGTGADNNTVTLSFGQNPTVQSMADAINAKEIGVKAVVTGSADSDSYGFYTNSAVTSRLSSDAVYRLYVPVKDNSVSVEAIRDILSGLEGVEVKALGDENSPSYQIRSALSKNGTESNAEVEAKISEALLTKYNKDDIAIIKTDFVGSTFSKSLAGKSIILAFFTIFLIWVYATIRFHWDFALGSIIALLHDCLIMFTFISWFQIEFSTTTLAAVLTIFGYSINATVVILDRVRGNLKMVQSKNFADILDKSLTETLSRSIITTVTTLFASISLYIFTTGSIKDFAVVLTIGLLSGCYSSMFISSGFIAFVRRNWKPSYENHVTARKSVVLEGVNV